TDARVAAEKVRTVATAREEMHEPILYPIAIVRDSNQKKAAQDFVNLVLSTEGQAILQKYGFVGVANR
ncbi:MAG TPA: substrate-binding domain-containing protein, partial [Pyrinomonadaceae bacterium]|nr:substrate-binding domain-containing protein [Pyrinomonadaceae bacterium]